MNFCSWDVRHSTGCGSVRVTSHDTGLSVVTEVGEWCHCYVNAPGPNGETERLIDLTRPLVAALGLDWDTGMYRVTVEPVSSTNRAQLMLPDTSAERKIGHAALDRDSTENLYRLWRDVLPDSRYYADPLG